MGAELIQVKLKARLHWRPDETGCPAGGECCIGVTWQGEFEGRAYQDKGEIIAFEPRQRLEVTHFSPLTGQEDRPENYHRVRYDLQPTNGGTTVRLTQDNSSSAEEAEHSASNWQMMLDGLKKVVELRSSS